MAKRIEVGMMVRIVSVDETPCDNIYEIRGCLGHVGEVLAIYEMSQGRMCDIEGAHPDKLWFAEHQLQPIDQESDDIKATREQGAPSFSKMMEDLNVEVV